LISESPPRSRRGGPTRQDGSSAVVSAREIRHVLGRTRVHQHTDSAFYSGLGPHPPQTRTSETRSVQSPPGANVPRPCARPPQARRRPTSPRRRSRRGAAAGRTTDTHGAGRHGMELWRGPTGPAERRRTATLVPPQCCFRAWMANGRWQTPGGRQKAEGSRQKAAGSSSVHSSTPIPESRPGPLWFSLVPMMAPLIAACDNVSRRLDHPPGTKSTRKCVPGSQPTAQPSHRPRLVLGDAAEYFSPPNLFCCRQPLPRSQ